MKHTQALHESGTVCIEDLNGRAARRIQQQQPCLSENQLPVNGQNAIQIYSVIGATYLFTKVCFIEHRKQKDQLEHRATDDMQPVTL